MAEILNLAAYGGLQIGLARHGKVVAFIVSPEDVEQLRQLREERVSPGFRDAAERLMDKHSKLLESLAKK